MKVWRVNSLADILGKDAIKTGLPGGWRMATIGELLKVRNGFAFKSTEYQEDGALLIRQSNLNGSRVTLDKAKFLPKTYLDKYKEFLVNKGDILIGMSGSIGKLCTYDRDVPALQNQRTGLLIFKDQMQKSWVWHYLPLLEKKLLKIGKGVAVQNVSASQIEAFPIPVAPFDQQARIVAEIEKQFSRLDKAVANLRRVKANIKRYKAAVLKAAVEGRLVETEAELARREGRSYETGAQFLQRILETRRSQWQGKGKYKEPAGPDTIDLPELPEGWVWATLPQLGELNRGKSKHRPRDDDILYGGPYPFIQTGDIRKSEGAITEYRQTYSELGLQQSRLWPAGTLCITIAANIAETGILKFAACFPDSVVGFLMEEGDLPTRYLEYFIRTARERLERFAPATAQKNINLEVLQAVALPLPPFSEQHRIVAEVDRHLSLANEAEAQVNANLQRAERLKQSILQSAFTGDFSYGEDQQSS